MEDRAVVLKRLAEAAGIMPLCRLGISPQCGFASHVSGNPITPEIQEQKLQLVMDVAGEVWG
jgi:5-methyltetrahydropteroyltriglutamate--homocysteine methyltransferase